MPSLAKIDSRAFIIDKEWKFHRLPNVSSFHMTVNIGSGLCLKTRRTFTFVDECVLSGERCDSS